MGSELDVVECDQVHLIHRAVHFEVDSGVCYRGALNSYIRQCYQTTNDGYLFKHLTTALATETALIQGTLLVICRPQPPPPADSIPAWISAFIHSFSPLQVNPRFVLLTPSVPAEIPPNSTNISKQ